MQLFLSFNSADRTSVIAVQKLLQARGITTFLDRDNLVSGLAWPQALEQALRAVDGVAVFIGCEFGGWQKREMWFALDRQVCEEKEGRPFPVIPVLLQGADLTPGFLFLNTWIDLRRGLDGVFTAEALNAFEQAIKATKPVRHCEDSAARVVEHPAAAICPYRGLQIFREEDAAFFFGRKAFAKQLRDFTLGKNLVAVVGPSGSGKSSVVQAGLIPLLRREQPPANTWDAVSFTPGDDPFHRLASALIPLLEPDLSETACLAEAEELGRNIAANRTRVEAVINRVIEKSNGTGRLLLIADQFEELFTLTPEPGRLPFAQALLHARGSAPVTILITLRADFYSQIITLDRELSDVIAPVQVNIGALAPDELRESINAPARLVGLEFESGLVDRILTDVGTEPGRLPLVGFALTEIWHRREGKRLTNRAYDEIGGVTGALTRRAEAEFARLNFEEQTGAQRLFSRLVRVARPEEAGEDTRQRTELSESDTLAKHVAKRLADARLLVTGDETGTGTISVEVAHEVLIRNWERLRSWLNEDREFLLWRQRLSGLFGEWERAQKSDEALLRGPLLIEAQKWFDQRNQDLSEQERKFISASRELQERQRRRRAVALAGAVAIALILFVGLFVMWRAAQEQAKIADQQKKVAEEQAHRAQEAVRAVQNALTGSFFRTIGVSNQNVLPRDEREALWELAQLDRGNAAVRGNLLKRWFGTPEAFTRGEARGGQGFRAVTGLNLEYHRFAISGAAELGRRLAAALEAALENPQQTDSDRFSSLVSALAALAAKMEPQAAAEIAKGLAAALENPQQTDYKETDYNRVSSLGSALAALAAKMEPQAAAEIAKGLAAALENPQETGDKETDYNRVSSLGSALAALAAKMEPQATAEIAKGLAAALENPQQTNSDRLSSLGSALEAVAAKMEPQAAAEIAKGLAAALEKETLSDRFSSLVSALEAVAAKMEPQAAAEIAKGLAAALEKETLSDRFSSLGSALAALAAKMEPQATAEIAKGLAAALENTQETDYNRFSSLGNALGALAAKMEPQATAEIAKGLAAALENTQVTDSYRLSILGSALAALAAKMEPQAAAEIARRGAQGLAAALENPQETDSGRLLSLGSALAALAAKMEPQATAEIAKGLAATLENTQETDYNRFSSLGNALAAVAAKMEPQATAEIAKGLAAALENTQVTDSYLLSSLASALAALAAKMEPQAAAEIARRGAQGLAAALENPQQTDSRLLSSLGSALAALAAKMEPQAAAEIAKGLAAALEKETNSDRVSSLGSALAALAAKMEPQAVAEIAKGLAAALENPQDTNPYRPWSLGSALAALAAKMEPQAAAEIAKGLAAALEKETSSDRVSSLGSALAALAAKMEPQAAAEIAKGLAAALENPQETDSDRLLSLGSALAALAAKMEPQAAAEIAKGLAAALENPQETDTRFLVSAAPSPGFYRLLSHGSALAALAAKMEPQAAAEIAKGLAAALENPQETDSDRLSSLGKRLAAFCALLPSAHHTQLLALSNLLLTPVSEKKDEGEEQRYDRKLLTAVCAQLSPQDLAEVLKYPFCTGEAEQIVLLQLEAKTSRQFGRDMWKFVEQADALGIKDIGSPAQRPLAKDALNELNKL